MTCKDYIFKLTSGQLEQAPLSLKLEATLHRALCRYCRTFTRNDARLDQALDHYRDTLDGADKKAD